MAMKASLCHLEATLMHLGHNVAARNPKRRLPIGTFYKGETTSMVMRAINSNADGLKVRGIVEYLCAEKGWNVDDPGLYGAISEKVSRILASKSRKGLIMRVAQKGQAGVWKAVNL